MPRACVLAVALVLPVASIRGQDEEAQAIPVLRPEAGGRVSKPEAVFIAKEGRVRDHTLVATPNGLHLFVITAKGEGKPALFHMESQDAGKKWSDAERVAVPLEGRAAWVKGRFVNKKIVLVIATNPSLPPHTPRISHFMGKKYTGFVGLLQVARLARDGKTFLGAKTLRLENPGGTIFPQHAFRPAFALLGGGDQLAIAGTTWFPHNRNGRSRKVWSLIVTHSKDGGETWQKVQFRRKAYPGLPMLKPAFLHGDGVTHAVFGDRFDKKLSHLGAEVGAGFSDRKSNLGELSQWNNWYDALAVPGAMVVTDTIETRSKRYGIVEFTSSDKGKTWRKLRVIDLDLDRAYAAFSHVAGKMRAHVAWHAVTLSKDGGAKWIRAELPEAFRTGHGTLIPRRGLAVFAVTQTKQGKSAVEMVVVTP